MADQNNSGFSDISDINQVLKDTTSTPSDKTGKLNKIKNKFGTHGYTKIDKYIEIVDSDGNKNYYGISEKKIKQSKYSKFKKKEENATNEFNNAFIDRVLDYDDLTQNQDINNKNSGALDTKDKLQKMVDLTNSKTETTVTDNEKKFAGKDKDVHITVDGKGSNPSDTSKSYKIGNFSGWNKSGSVVDYDSDTKVGFGNKDSGGSYDQKWKKHKTMYWKKDTSTAEESTNEGVFKKKKKNNKQNKKNESDPKNSSNDIGKDDIDEIKQNMDDTSPIIEVGETSNTEDEGNAYVLFKLKKEPLNAEKIELSVS